MEVYDIYHPQLLDALFRDEIEDGHWLGDRGEEGADSFFVKFVHYNYNRFAREYGCQVVIHDRRTREARDIWLDDCDRALKKLHASTEIDEFKTAGFLGYWLRRRCVVDEIRLAVPRLAADSPTSPQKEFMKYGNEICAFDIGLHFCLRFQVTSLEDAKRIKLDHGFIRESAAFMSTKNVSPHSLYLIYRGLFTSIRR